MDPVPATDILNELLVGEYRALLPRLIEARAFITADRTADFENVRRMAADRDRCMARLVETIIALGGEPGPRSSDMTSACFHYNELPVLLPRVIADEEALCRKYVRAVHALSDCEQAAEVVADIAGRHRVHLELLRKLAADAVPAG
ncbi:MAG TPA: hypothetical protein VM243_07195 [Phycisphaerae bacterium]|nr:hypothetical protein [Phycisphaerae bacterium]